MKQLGVGLLGFGTVGAGVVDGLQRNRELLAQRTGVDIVLRRIADVDLDRDRGVKVDRAILTKDARAVINDPAVDIVVELIGGTGIAKTLMIETLNAHKPVVTANKKLLAEYGEDIFGLAQKNGVDLYFGASVGGGIPIVRVLREGLVANNVQRILGILNGTCNYILTRMENEGAAFDDVLKAAQAAGYAEADPSLDIDGHDTAHKTALLASLAYGFHVPVSAISVEGIRGLASMDVQYTHELGYRIKLLAHVRRVDAATIEVRVHPTLVPLDHMLASVSQVFNAVMVQSDLAGDTLYYGRGAGREPTASTVIGDIADIARNLVSGQPRHSRGVALTGRALRVRPPAESRCRYYLRLMVLDKPGSLGIFSGILGKHNVSLSAVNQRVVQKEGGHVPVVSLTHVAQESELDAALAEIYAAGVVAEKPVKLRILD
jgi:homoserine dehydrogenase